MWRKILLFLVFLYSYILQAYTVSIQITEKSELIPVIHYAVRDVQNLLVKAGAEKVSVNTSADVYIEIPDIPKQKTVSAAHLNYPVAETSDRTYSWSGKSENNQYYLTLKAYSYEGIGAGLYGLLQDVLGFCFYHPRETLLPDLSDWPLKEDYIYSSRPRFNKMGFHLHTMHPIELTEALLEEKFPGGEDRIREYIDWLARNRQNYFEFNLLETINRKEWPKYAQKWVGYMADRGILAGLDLSLHMKQQSAFKLYRNPAKSFRPKKKQIYKRFKELSLADWKYWNVEFSTTEFSMGNARKKVKLRSYVHELLYNRGIHLTGRQHVVKPETMVKPGHQNMEIKDTLDRYRGTMIHTVMFYTLNDSLAPVYGNENLHHMRDQLLREREQRETWYYPESAYWITFDNSIPMYLSPYLNARLDDILYCDSLRVEGHLTFSSGWEWSYWLTDWSIANWSWESTINGEKNQPYPEQYFDKLVKDTSSQHFFREVNRLQNEMIKEKNLIQYLTAATVTDEMPLGKNLPLHPMPNRSYEYLRNQADAKLIDSVYQHVIPALDYFSEKYWELRSEHPTDSSDVLKEITESLDIAALRAEHRAATLKYLLNRRIARIKNDKSAEDDAVRHLKTAKEIRERGLKIVQSRETAYRYPLKELAFRRPSQTSYYFGYLYPVHQLHFWEREEQQALNNKWKFWYMNIWDVFRIIGIVE